MRRDTDVELEEIDGNDIKITLIEPSDDKEIAAYEIGSAQVKKLGIAFMFLFLAFGSSQNLVSSLYKELDYSNLGVISLFVVYFCFAAGSLISKHLIHNISYPLLFTLSNLGYTSYIGSGVWVFLCSDDSSSDGLCSIEAIYSIVILTAAACGISSSTLWVGQGKFIDEICKSCPSRRGTLFGNFQSFMAVSTIFGSVLATLALKLLGNMGYFIMVTTLSLVSAFLFSKIRDPQTAFKENSQELRVTVVEQIKAVFLLMKEDKAFYIVPLFFMRGAIIAFYSSFMYVIVKMALDSEQKLSQTQYLSYVIMFIGFFGVVSGFISGKLADKFDLHVLAIGGAMLCGLGIFLSLLGLYTQSYLLCFVIASVWGFCDNYCQSLIGTICSKDYQGRVEIFSLRQTVMSLSTSFSLILIILLQTIDASVYLIYMLLVQVITTLSIAILMAKQKNKPAS